MKFIKEVFERNLPVFLTGGYADDALLSQKSSRPHSDIDLVAFRSDVEIVKNGLENMGLQVTQDSSAAQNKLGLLTAKGKNLHVDVAIIDVDDSGAAYMESAHPSTGKSRRVEPGAEFVNEGYVTLDGISVRTLSPITQIRSKGLHAQLGLAPERAKDTHSKEQLVRHFYPGQDPSSDQFKFKITEVT